VHDVLRPVLFDDMLADSRPVDNMTLCFVSVIRELVVIMGDVLAFTDSHFSSDDVCPFIKFLCTV